jgi:hypothetical protein
MRGDFILDRERLVLDAGRRPLGCRLTYQANRRAAPMLAKMKSRAGPSG